MKHPYIDYETRHIIFDYKETLYSNLWMLNIEVIKFMKEIRKGYRKKISIYESQSTPSGVL